MKEKIVKFLLILVIGGLGGILAEAIILPYLASIPPFSRVEFLKRIKDSTVIINKTEEIIITENTALEQAIDKISPCLVTIEAIQNKRIVAQGSGFIITNDGWIATAADLAPVNADEYLVYRNGNSFIVQSTERDSENSLALLKIDQTNLPVVSFLAEFNNLDLGERVILIAAKRTKDAFNKFVNLGTIREINQEALELNLEENDYLANGGPLINIKGEVIGLNLINKKFEKTIPSLKIKIFIDSLKF